MHYLQLDGNELPTIGTLYYDPVLDVHHRLPIYANLATAMYAAPQEPADARRLFDAACSALGMFGDGPIDTMPGPRGAATALALSREWGMTDFESRVRDAIEATLEPTWDAATGEFTWGLGLDEPHPRGQYNAYLAAAEANSFGAWEALSAAPLAPCAQVVDVDFPSVALSRAEWTDGELDLTLDVLRPDPEATTNFRIVDAASGNWTIAGLIGATIVRRGADLHITVPLRSGALKISPH